MFAAGACKSYEFIQALRQYTYAWQIDCLTACSSPPTGEFFLPDNSPGGRSLISDPIYSSKTVRRVIISPCPSHTSHKVSVVHVFKPRCRGFMNISWIGIVDVIHGQLNKDFLMRVENERLKLNGLALIFSPGRMIIKLMSAFLQGKT